VAVLLDTHAFLWWCEDARELTGKARKAIATEECRVSLVSLWEIAVKVSLRKLTKAPRKLGALPAGTNAGERVFSLGD
jgi:PIN domain nuclease of toxin-antitoxin system